MNNLEKSEDIFAGTQVLTTLRDWTRFAVSLFSKKELFFGQGMSSAYDEAVYLLCHTLGLPTDGGVETFFDAKLTPGEIDEIKSVLFRRAVEHVPAAYITREAWLGGFRFYVDERTIVPRSYFTEMIPEKILPWVPGMDVEAVERIADVCTGGASIAILLANAFPNAMVDACDISDAALEVARKNVTDYGLDERVFLYKSDVLANVSAEDASYDIIVSNPPYEPEELRETLPEEFRKEPDNALFSGADGLDVIRKLLPQAAKKLKRNGVLLIEVGGLQNALEEAFPQLEISWLDTADGSDCICAISASALREVFARTQ